MKKIFENKKAIIFVITFLIVVAMSLLILKDTYSISDTGSTIDLDTAVEQSDEIIGGMKISCDSDTILPGESATCTIEGSNFTKEISSFRTVINLDSNLILESIEKDSSWEGSAEGGIIDLYTDVNKTGSFNVATFTVRAKEIDTGVSAFIEIENTVVSDENFDEYVVGSFEISVRIKSTINTLSDLSVSGVDFAFDSETSTYDLTTDLEEVTISATATSESATVSGDIGTKQLRYGKNTFKITVVSEANSSKVYTLVINRPESLSFDDDVTVDEENMYLHFDKSNLSISDILNKVHTSGNVAITDSQGNTVSGTGYVGTGYKMNVNLSTEQYSYTVIILGDTTGDGQTTVADVSKLFQHYRKTYTMEDIYVLAGDVQNDDEIKLTDVAKLFQYVRGNIETLK